ncbi:MAG: M15 family metallopeptidase [Candidatus Eremiobacterota bacterium]
MRSALVLALLLCLAAGLAAEAPRDDTASELVELVLVDPTLRLDIRYATADNFMGFRLYSQARAFLQKPAAEALKRANGSLREQGYGLVVYDGYRPWSVTRLMWDRSPPEWRGVYVADPARGSRHNRGCAVDCSLFDLESGSPVDMPSGYDEFSPRAHADYAGAPPEQRRMRDLLRREMEKQGFTVLPEEWWHFDYQGWRAYPVLDVDFARLDALRTDRGRE